MSARRDLLKGLAFNGPWIVGVAAFLAYPVIAAFYYSLCHYSVLLPPVFLGVDHYAELIGHDGLFWQSLWNTSVFAAGSVFFGILIALALALLLNARVKGLAFYRTLFFLPTLMPVVATCMLWMWMLSGDGIVNHLLGGVGIEGPNWLNEAAFIKSAIIMMAVWGAGNAMIIILAGLQDVPESLMEAALIDGAGFWRRLKDVTIPMISPVLYFNVIMGVIGGFQVFTQAFIMTGPSGGDGNSAMFYVLRLFTLAFHDLRMGYACAMAVILFAIIVAATLLMHRLSLRWVHYER